MGLLGLAFCSSACATTGTNPIRNERWPSPRPTPVTPSNWREVAFSVGGGGFKRYAGSALSHSQVRETRVDGVRREHVAVCAQYRSSCFFKVRV